MVLGFWFTSQHFYMKYMYLRMLDTKLWDRYRYIIHKILGVCSLNFFNGFIASDTVRVQRRYKITLKDNNTCSSQLLESWSLSLGGGTVLIADWHLTRQFEKNQAQKQSLVTKFYNQYNVCSYTADWKPCVREIFLPVTKLASLIACVVCIWFSY